MGDPGAGVDAELNDPPDSGGSRKRIWLWGRVGALVLLILSGSTWVLFGGSAPAQPRAADLLTLRPTNVRVTEVSDSAHVSWIDHADRRFPWVVAVQGPGSDDPTFVSPDGEQSSATAAVVTDLDLTSGHCFRVGILVGTDDTTIVWSDESACLGDASPPPGWPAEVRSGSKGGSSK